MSDGTYTLNVSETVIAQHFLTVPDPGPEGELHSHRFEIEVELETDSLGEYGYVADIDEVRDALGTVASRFRDETLNDRPEFEGLNPSVEHFARIVHRAVRERASLDGVQRLRVRIWEDDVAWAAYERAV